MRPFLDSPESKKENEEFDFTHRRPHIRRRRSRILDLDGPWKFSLDADRSWKKPEDVREWPLRIEVPYAPETSRSGIGDTGFHPCCWYQRDFEVLAGSGRLFVHFGAVDHSAQVWVNQCFVGEHDGGYTPFSFDITDSLRGGSTQTIAVRVEDDPADLAKPRGKQDWKLEPHSIWYPRTTGIWQSVWLEWVPEIHIERLRWTPILTRWEIGLEAFISGSNSLKDIDLSVRLTAEGKVLAEDTYRVIEGEVYRRIAFSDPGIDDFRNELLWSPEKPTLIQAELTLRRGSTLVDEVRSYTALRSAETQRDRFLLNGRPYYLRLILDQGYWPETMLTPPSDEAIQRDITLTKQMGFNGVRKHQKIEDPRYLYWADVLGLLVWEEMPSAYRNTYESVERTTKEWCEIIDRDYNHPCIIVWVPFNESWGVPDLPAKATHRHCVQALYHLTKTLDATRPVVGNDGWESIATDLIGIHDYDGDAVRLAERYRTGIDVEDLFHRKRPGGRILTLEDHPHEGQPILLTEFGGVALRNGPSMPASTEWGYSVSVGTDDFRVRYQALLRAVHASELFAGFCYTQLADTFQEVNGLLYADRTPKIPLSVISRATRGEHYVETEVPIVPTPFSVDESNNRL